MRAAARPVLLAIAVLAGTTIRVSAGHEITFYPSYYPDEIEIVRVAPADAAALLSDGALHAYLGALPGEMTDLPEHVKAIESLESFVVLSVDPASPAHASSAGRCATLQGALAELRSGDRGFVFHPYPVTPYHPDYLHHLDRIEDAMTAVTRRAEGGAAGVTSLGEVPLTDLGASSRTPPNAWLGPPWAKEGWFQANELLAPAIADAETRAAADALYRRLVRGEYADLAEQTDLERRLVATLTGDCSRAVAGYRLRREAYNDEYSAGIENIGHDSQSGLNSPVFVRTVKLKDYPWNGKVSLGLPEGAEAAWNPVAGFSDAAGRLIWSIVGDPALLPLPYNASWIPNRLDFTLERPQGQSGGFKVPADAVLPNPVSGALEAIPGRSFASAKLAYRMWASPFLDGTEPVMADLLYGFIHAYRWGSGTGASDPQVAAATALLRERLAGIRPLRVERAVVEIAPGIETTQVTPEVEIYLRDTPGDDAQLAALAPPWSVVPWHLMVLMEEAVLRRQAAFSGPEAERKGVPWLDLVRDPAQLERLRALVAELEQTGYRPAALEALVGEAEARARWRALGRFAEEHGHLLVTSGPYRLKAWGPDAVTFQVLRDIDYPLGFGTFDPYVHPLRAVLREATLEADGLVVRVEVEKVVKIKRSTELRLVALDRSTARGAYGALVASRYLLIGPDGAVARAGNMAWQGDDRFLVELPEDMPPGRYAVLAAVYLDGNALAPSTRIVRFEAGG